MPDAHRDRILFVNRGVASVALVYLGMLVGVSFIATPAKFLAPTLPLAQALDVGRYTFGVFGWVELALAVILAVLPLFVGHRLSWMLGIAILVAVSTQLVWLRPALDARVEIYLVGEKPPPASFHTIYGVLDLLKCALLVWLATAAAQRPTIRSVDQSP